MIKTILIFGSLAAAIFLLFELNKFSVYRFEDASEVFLLISGLLFILIGFIIHRILSGKQENHKARPLKNSRLSKREHRVLLLMNDGLSNNEIAEKLFISENTVKTHVSNILSKLNARRRTEAVKIGRDLDII